MNKKTLFLMDRFKIWGRVNVCLQICFLAAALKGVPKGRWFPAICVSGLLLTACLAWGWFRLWKTYQEETRHLELIASMPLRVGQYPAGEVYNRELKLLLERWEAYTKESSALEMSRRQAQYQALQNQINPHFLYNTLESIRSEALLAGLDSVADMCEALASFFRYTISNMENLVTVAEELDNIHTYFYIQQYRFGERLHLKIHCEQADQETADKCLIPKLTLQPIVENAIIHGIEQKVGEGTVSIRLQCTQSRLLIHVDDDGMGMDQQTLDKINRNMTERSVQGRSRGGLAVGNVNNRLKLLFGDDYGVTVFSTRGVGTEVEITLPLTTEQDRKSIQGKMEELQ